MDMMPSYLIPAFQIIWIDILLSGDNAVVIALACRNLPENQRRIGLLAGAGAAVGLRIVFTLIANSMLDLPWIRFGGGLLLLWVAVKLLVGEDDHEEGIAPAGNLWKAIQTIVIADVVMSLDNILAIAAVAKGNAGLIIFGLLASVPLVVAGSQLILAMLHRAPWIVWAGAALLGWVAGDIMAEDRAVTNLLGFQFPHLTLPLPWGSIDIGALSALGAALVLVMGLILKRKQPASA